MRRIDLILKIIEMHDGLTAGQILNIMEPPNETDTQYLRARRRADILQRCRALETQGYIRHEKDGRTSIWFPVRK